MPHLKKDLNGKRILVVGAGESGRWAAELLKRRGAFVCVTSRDPLSDPIKNVFNKKHIPFEVGHTARFIKGLDLVVVSPGVLPNSLPIRIAKRFKLPVHSEIEFASRSLNGKWAAVTGTNGKTTTASLLHHMIRKNVDCDLCGNVGRALSRSVLENSPSTFRVVETSSFQLYYSAYYHPRLAIILNLKPNHLDWHKDLSEYYESKIKIASNLGHGDTLIVNGDDKKLMSLIRNTKARKVVFSKKRISNGFFTKGDSVYMADRGKAKKWVSLRNTNLIGDHNKENILAAVAAAVFFGVPRKSVQRSIDEFRPLQNRLEYLGSVSGVSFVNDSKATTLESTKAALNSFRGNVVLVAGGKAKEKTFKGILKTLKTKVSYLVLYGEASTVIAKDLKAFKQITIVKDFDRAVKTAFAKSNKEDTLLLSPMCSSFDQFKSFEARGEAFRRIFEEIQKENL